MDYWRFATRTVGTQIERLRAAPPHGIQRHYARLAIVRFPASVLNCRESWPPDVGGGEVAASCDCSVCVTADGHNAGELTIQAAIDQLPAAGGTVCLGTGAYNLGSPLTVAGRPAVRIPGQGIGTVLAYAGAGAAIQLSGGFDIQRERFSLFVRAPGGDRAGNPSRSHGISGLNTALIALRRLAVVVTDNSPDGRASFGIALDGVQLGDKIEECLVVAPIAIGSRSSLDAASDEPDDPNFVAFAELRVQDNILLGGRDGVHFDRVALNIADAVFARNLVVGGDAGIRANWADIPTGATLIQDGTIQAADTALVIGVSDLHLRDCEITAGAGGGDGLRLVPNIVSDHPTDARVIGNAIFDVVGAGIRLTGDHGVLMIKQNILRRCGEAGITTSADARIRHLAIANNIITRASLLSFSQNQGTLGSSSGGDIEVVLLGARLMTLVVERERIEKKTGKRSSELAFGITSRPPGASRRPAGPRNKPQPLKHREQLPLRRRLGLRRRPQPDTNRPRSGKHHPPATLCCWDHQIKRACPM
jgi:hypothetical protein